MRERTRALARDTDAVAVMAAGIVTLPWLIVAAADLLGLLR